MTRPCGCPASPAATVTDEARHAEWHREIAPLATASAAEMEAARGYPSTPMRTYVDEQFEQARRQEQIA